MIGSLNALLAASVLFVASHFLLSSRPLRPRLNSLLGEMGFRILYSAVALGSFVWMAYAYGAAPYYEVWPPLPELRMIPVFVMPFAFILAVAGLTTKSPTVLGGEAWASAQDPAPGILRITRHPFLWAATLWAASHLLAQGDLATLVLCGAIMVLSLAGMRHIDQRREASLGSAWGPVAMTTSLIPFAAIVTGRTKMDWAGLGIWRVVAGVAAYVVFLHLHGPLFGVAVLPSG